MKKVLFLVFVGLLFFGSLFSTQNVKAETTSTNSNKVEYTLFHSDTCPHCKTEIKFINDKVMKKYGDFIDLKMYEVSSFENQQIFQQYLSFYKVQSSGVPVAFIDGETVIGYGSDKTTGAKIMSIIEKKLLLRGLVEPKVEVVSNSEFISIPFLGDRFRASLFTIFNSNHWFIRWIQSLCYVGSIVFDYLTFGNGR